MRNVFLVSDTHFGHEATCTKFKKPNGDPLRPFPNADVMNEKMVQLWNQTVGPEDLVIHLGDVVMSHRHLHLMDRLNGEKELILGNHDPVGGKRGKKFNFEDYFTRVMAMKVLDDMILTHIPVHETQIGRFGTNVHGHLHGTEVMWNQRGVGHRPDPRYLCVSVEHTDFRPIHIDEVRLRIKARQEAAHYYPKKGYGNGSAD